jgi:hypothetical protein
MNFGWTMLIDWVRSTADRLKQSLEQYIFHSDNCSNLKFVHFDLLLTEPNRLACFCLFYLLISTKKKQLNVETQISLFVTGYKIRIKQVELKEQQRTLSLFFYCLPSYFWALAEGPKIFQRRLFLMPKKYLFWRLEGTKLFVVQKFWYIFTGYCCHSMYLSAKTFHRTSANFNFIHDKRQMC